MLTSPNVSREPFFWQAPGTKKAALLVHGFLASPYIMRSLAKVLHDVGYTVKAIRLPGHGTVPRDLRHVSYEDWQTTVDTAVIELQASYPEVIIVGFSLGTILGLISAFKFNISKLILLSPAFKISPMAKLFKYLSYLHLDLLLPDLFCTQSEKENLGSYRHFPVHGVAEVQKAVDVYRQLLAKQKALPHVYVAASRDDATVSFSGVKQAMKIYTKGSRFQVYDHYSHVAIPVAPTDPYYGKQGSYYGKLPPNTEFGEPTWKDKCKPIKRLTYNPNFAEMSVDILDWLGES